MKEKQIELAKRRAWVESIFDDHGLMDEEIMAFSPCPSDNFSLGFDAGLAYAAASQWISVTDRLPETDVEVIAYVPAIYPAFSRFEIAYHDGEDWFTTGDKHVRPSRWMPIPPLNPDNHQS